MYKEDIEPFELDDDMYRLEREHIMEQEYKHWETKQKKNKFVKVFAGKEIKRNRKRKIYATDRPIKINTNSFSLPF